MAKMVGLSRNLKLAWLKMTVRLLDENLPEEEFKSRLNEYLGFEIKSATNLRKTREILMHIWYYPDENMDQFRLAARECIKKYPDYEVQIHWSMMLLVYPIFVDATRLIGRISEFQEELTSAQIKQKVFDEWGERATLYHSLDKLIATLRDLGALTMIKAGRYTVNHYDINQEDVAALMIYAAMKTSEGIYYPFHNLTSFNSLFPFRYQISKEQLMQDNRFTLANYDGQLTVALKE